MIYHGDARDLIGQLGPVVVVSDPPYGLEPLAGGYGRGEVTSTTIQGDADTVLRDTLLAAHPDGPLAIFSTPRLPEPPGRWDWRLVWDKAQPGMNGGAWRYSHELIYVRGDGWQRLSDASVSVLRYTRDVGSGLFHPHEKPIPLMKALIMAAPPGVIFDPFMGSGSTLRAAKDCGRHAIGCEVELEYCAIAKRRLAQEVLF